MERPQNLNTWILRVLTSRETTNCHDYGNIGVKMTSTFVGVHSFLDLKMNAFRGHKTWGRKSAANHAKKNLLQISIGRRMSSISKF